MRTRTAMYRPRLPLLACTRIHSRPRWRIHRAYAELSTSSGLSSRLPKRPVQPAPLDAIVAPSIPQKLGIHVHDAGFVLEESLTIAGEAPYDRLRCFKPRV